MKTTNREVNVFLKVSEAYLQQFKEESKLAYAIKKMQTRSTALMKAYQTEVEDIKIKHASVDEKDNVVYLMNEKTGEPVDFKFTKNALIAKNKEINELYESKVDIDPYIATSLPKELPSEFMSIFEGFVIAALPEIAEEKKEKK